MENTPNILIVDDDEGMRQTLEMILKKEGYQLATVETGETALAQVQEKFFNIALLDIRLPDMAGTNLLAHLKELHPEMEVLLITGYATLESAMQAVAEGASHYFIKPLNMDEVLAKIKEALDKQHLVMENKRLYQAALKELAERKKVEEALWALSLRYEAILAAVPDIIMEVDANKIYTWANQAGFEFFGDDVLGKEATFYFEGEQDTYGIVQSLFDGDENLIYLESWQRHKDGEKRLLAWWCKALKDEKGNVIGALSSARDITKQRRVEEEIRQRNRELTLLNQVIAASATSLDPETILETACHELARAFDVPQAVAVLLNEKKTEVVVVAEYLAKESQSRLLNKTISIENLFLAKRLLINRSPLVVEDARSDPRLASISDLLRQRNLISLLIVPLIIEGAVAGGLCLGATESRCFSAEEVNLAWSVADQVSGALSRTRLDKERRQLSTAIEQTAESVIITDPEGKIVYVNPTFERVTGYSRAEVIGQSPRILKSGKQDAVFYKELWGTITAGKVWHGRFVNKKKDGTLYTEEATISPVRNEKGDIVNYVGLQRDVTHELELEEQYRRAQRMEAVGQLTGGIAHDFNNLLTAINGFAELIQFRLSPDDPLQDLVKNILQSGQRAANLVSQLLAFSRKQIIEPKVLNLNTSVIEMSAMLQRIIGENIKLEVVLTPELWPVKVDPAQIEQVIVNLAVNARDAMPDGGRLIIETSNTVLNDEYVANHLGTQPGKHVLLAISDTGVGMSEEEKARIFEPFFTTKEVGKGTGLGLATVFGIVKQSGGNIWVYSEEGHGSTFKIYLPCTNETIRAASPPKGEIDMPTGNETILLVEDDTGVRDLARQVLQRQGYTLLEAKNGEEALELSAQYSEPIHLLLTDVIMPGMNGKTLADQLAQRHPDLKTLFMSGYTDNTIAHHGVLDPGVTFLQKPFSSLTLTHQVRAVLDD
jgi:PAS domain S-box-containing protein